MPNIHGRVLPGREEIVRNDELEIPQRYFAEQFAHIADLLRDMTQYFRQEAKPLDERQGSWSATETGDASLEVLPTFEGSELIRGIIVTGPANAVATVTLGDRVWPLTIPSTGIIVVGPLFMVLTRNERRLMTVSPAGECSLELMGHLYVGQ